jgi:hypothetical protein
VWPEERGGSLPLSGGLQRRLIAATAVGRKYTINLHKRLHKISFKNRAPRAIREIKKFAQKALGTKYASRHGRPAVGPGD